MGTEGLPVNLASMEDEDSEVEEAPALCDVMIFFSWRCEIFDSLQVTSGMTGVLCRWQVTYTINGQSLGCMRTPAAWAQVGWNAVEQRPWEHCTQQPLTSLFIRFLQYTHFCTGGRDTTTERSAGEVQAERGRKQCLRPARERERGQVVENEKRSQTRTGTRCHPGK